MKLLGLKYTVELNGVKNELVVDLKDADILLLRGANAGLAVHVLEDLLAKDFTGNSYVVARQHGVFLSNNVTCATLVCEEAKLRGQNRSVTLVGKQPQIHCITTLSKGKIRSFMYTDELKQNELYTDTRKFTNQLPDVYWVRVVETTNKLLGYEAVHFKNDKLSFNFTEKDNWSVEAQKMAYTLIAESLLTPNNCSRVVLISKADVLNAVQILKLSRMMKNMRNHGIIIITEGVEPKDIYMEGLVTCRNVR